MGTNHSANKTNNENVRIVVVPITGKQENHPTWESYPRLLGECFFTWRCFPDTKDGARELVLKCCCFPGAQSSDKKFNVIGYYCFYLNLSDVAGLLRRGESVNCVVLQNVKMKQKKCVFTGGKPSPMGWRDHNWMTSSREKHGNRIPSFRLLIPQKGKTARLLGNLNHYNQDCNINCLSETGGAMCLCVSQWQLILLALSEILFCTMADLVIQSTHKVSVLGKINSTVIAFHKSCLLNVTATVFRFAHRSGIVNIGIWRDGLGSTHL